MEPAFRVVCMHACRRFGSSKAHLPKQVLLLLLPELPFSDSLDSVPPHGFPPAAPAPAPRSSSTSPEPPFQLPRLGDRLVDVRRHPLGNLLAQVKSPIEVWVAAKDHRRSKNKNAKTQQGVWMQRKGRRWWRWARRAGSPALACRQDGQNLRNLRDLYTSEEHSKVVHTAGR